MREHKKNHHRKHQILIVTEVFNDLSYARLEVGENKTECDLLVRIRSLPAKRRAVSEEAEPFFFCFSKFWYQLQLHLCEWMALIVTPFSFF